jgi:hypothetical protein
VDARNSHARLVYNRPPWLKLSPSVPPPSDANRKNCPPRSRHRLRNDPEAGSQPPTAQQDFPDSVPNNNHPSAWPPPRSPPPLPTRSVGTLPSTARSESPFTQQQSSQRLASTTKRSTAADPIGRHTPVHGPIREPIHSAGQETRPGSAHTSAQTTASATNTTTEPAHAPEGRRSPGPRGYRSGYRSTRSVEGRLFALQAVCRSSPSSRWTFGVCSIS